MLFSVVCLDREFSDGRYKNVFVVRIKSVSHSCHCKLYVQLQVVNFYIAGSEQTIYYYKFFLFSSFVQMVFDLCERIIFVPFVIHVI